MTRGRLFSKMRILTSGLLLLLSLCILLCSCDPVDAIDDFMNSIFPSNEGEDLPPPELPTGSMRVHFIDVGQADCILLETPDGCVLVDAGDLDRDVTEHVADYLRALSIEKIDYFVLTHPHADHIGGAPTILEEFQVGRVLMTDAATTTAIFNRTLDAIDKNDVPVTRAEVGESYTLGALRMTALAPASVEDADLNNTSIVLRVDYGGSSLMLTGDAETESLDDVLESFPASYLDCDAMKAGHHGAENANSESFLEAVSPELVVISCGKDNSYGHPHEEALERFDTVGADVYRTDVLGTVVLISEDDSFRVEQP